MQATQTCPWLEPQLIPWLRKARPECLTFVSLVAHYQVCWRHLHCTLADYKVVVLGCHMSISIWLSYKYIPNKGRGVHYSPCNHQADPQKSCG